MRRASTRKKAVSDEISIVVMAGLDPAIHVFLRVD
jgi:hypothetical protein